MACLWFFVPRSAVQELIAKVSGDESSGRPGAEYSQRALPVAFKFKQEVDLTVSHILETFGEHRSELFGPLGDQELGGKTVIPVPEFQAIRDELVSHLEARYSLADDRLSAAGIKFCDQILTLQRERLRFAENLSGLSAAQRAEKGWPVSYLRAAREVLNGHETLRRFRKGCEE